MAVVLREVMFSLNELITLHRYNIHKTAQSNGLYIGQNPILEFVEKNENCTQSELAEQAHVSPASIAVSVKRMQKAGLLEKSPNEDDLRVNYIKITQKGKETAKKCRSEFDKVDKKLFNGFSDEELKIFVSYIQRLKDNLSDDEPSRMEIIEFVENEMKKHSKEEEKDD